MKIVMLNGQNHKGSTYHIGRMIADKITGENEIREFFFPRDLNHFCMGCYKCIEDEKACLYYEEKRSFWMPSKKQTYSLPQHRITVCTCQHRSNPSWI